MRRLLIDPAFPDVVAQWAEEESRFRAVPTGLPNDTMIDAADLSDPLLALAARAEIDATRLW